MNETPYSVSHTIQIHAPSEAVWRCLISPSCLTSDTGIIRLIGRPAAQQRLKLWSEVSPNRAFALRVVVFEPALRMVWQGGMPLGLFTGRRTFTLSPAGGVTTLTVQEVFTGPLAPMIWKSMPDLNPSFKKFAQSIKHQAEASLQEIAS